MFNNPVILITGASSGIGYAAARTFAEQGYRTVVAARREDRLQALVEEIQAAGGHALPVAADVSDLNDVNRIVRAAVDSFGQVDILFNNAGFGRMGWLEELDPRRDIKAQVETNLLGVIQMAQAVLPSMMERRSGHIINMVSLAGFVGTPTYSIYAATKYGVRGFSEALRREVRVHGIRVSGIYPGAVDNDFSKHARIKRKTGFTTPRFLKLSDEDVARAVWRLANRPRAMMVLPWMMKPAVWINDWFPWLVDWVIEKRFVQRERGNEEGELKDGKKAI